MDLTDIRQLTEGMCIAKGNEADAVVGEGRHARDSGGFLATAETTSGDEHASKLALQFTLLPEMASSIPKGLQRKNKISVLARHRQKGRIYAYLPLRWEVAVTGGDTAKEAVVVGEIAGVDNRIIWLGGRMHLGQDLLRESLSDPRIV
jgi:hypothetical protein